jgi:hypothetical protein
MSHEFQRQHKNMDTFTIIIHIKELFDITSKTGRYKTFKEFFYCKMTKVFLSKHL